MKTFQASIGLVHSLASVIIVGLDRCQVMLGFNALKTYDNF